MIYSLIVIIGHGENGNWICWLYKCKGQIEVKYPCLPIFSHFSPPFLLLFVLEELTSCFWPLRLSGQRSITRVTQTYIIDLQWACTDQSMQLASLCTTSLSTGVQHWRPVSSERYYWKVLDFTVHLLLCEGGVVGSKWQNFLWNGVENIGFFVDTSMLSISSKTVKPGNSLYCRLSTHGIAVPSG